MAGYLTQGLEEVFEKRSLYGFETILMCLLDDEDPYK